MSTQYFYIIKHISSNKYYAGSQWAKNCSPDNLLKKYFTSSTKIHELINEYGVDDFSIEDIITDFSEFDLRSYVETHPELIQCEKSYIFETMFLEENECAQSPNWINSHNNNFKTMPGFSSENSKKIFLEKYGVDNISKSQEIKNKKIKTCLKHYCVEYYIQSEEGKENYKEVCKEKYGVDNIFKSKEFKEKNKKDCIEKYGVNHHQSRVEIREKISKALSGRTLSEEHCDNISKKTKGLVMAKNIVTGEITRIKKDDFIKNKHIYSGSTSGKIPVKDSNGNTFLVEKDDSRYISGELVHISKGTKNSSSKNKINAKCSKTGISLGKVHKDDPRWASGEIVNILKGTVGKAKGRKWVNHPEHSSIQVPEDKLQEYFDQGYSLGRKRKEEQNENLNTTTTLLDLFE